ncbi:MAG: ankyrin repeat domain-containing protein, partial [Verrucomicrobia bacterium]|nr:ankyrin repeat domain-containing protein [Verrucomicrobiota bacterium]
VRLLTDNDAVVPQTIATKSILSAIHFDRHTILEYLLKKGFKPGMTANEFGEMPVFIEAVLKGHLRGAEILLQHGADPNAMAEARPGKDFSPCGSALHLTIPPLEGNEGYFAAANWLLEKGAKPDIPDPYYGLTPLHYAAKSETPGADNMMGKLLDAGADPNRRSNARMVSDGLRSEFFLNSTPLEVALVYGSPATRLEKVRLLLKHGAKPNLEGSKVGSALAVAISFDDPRAVELVQVLGDAGYPMKEPKLLESAIKKNDPKLIGLLFKYGANPNLRNQFGDSLLVQACKAGVAARVALLVEAGADVHALSSDGQSALRIAAGSDNRGGGMSCVGILLAAGAKPDDKWRESGFDQTPIPIRHVLIDKFIIPTLVSESDIFLQVDALSVQTIRMATRSGKAQVPELASWLLANHTKIKILSSGDDLKPRWAIWRKSDSGELVKLDVDLNRAPEIPALRWGDVVSVVIDKPNSYFGGGGPRYGLPQDVLWSLRKRISFPITVEIEGKPREITVRGDRIFFDPTKNEVPLQGVQYVIELLRPPNACPDSVATAIVISRQGWPDVRLAYASQEAKKFPLEPGDRVKLEVKTLNAGDIAAARKKAVIVEVADYPFARKVAFSSAAICTPTLIQAFVEMQLPEAFSDMRWAEADWKILREYSSFGTSLDFILLPHPDLSRIRIHRLQEDGAEKVIDVDLAKIIAAATDLTTPAEARQADVMLQAGDMVEISLLKDRLDQPWKGFTAAEEAFFNKALAGRVQVIDSDGKVTIRELKAAALYRNREWLDSRDAEDRGGQCPGILGDPS